MALITTADLENAKLDVTDLGEFVNNDQVVTTRTGATYDSVSFYTLGYLLMTLSALDSKMKLDLLLI